MFLNTFYQRMLIIIIFPWRIGPLALCLQAALSSAADATAAHVPKPFSFSSLSIVLLQVLRGQPLFRLPNATSCIIMIKPGNRFKTSLHEM